MPEALILSTWSFGQRSNAPGWDSLELGGSSLDAVEAVSRFAEADLSNRTVGAGALPDASGRVSLDASIMLSPSRRGAVANIRRFMHPISIARRVMESTRHILLAGAEADDFALAEGFEPAELLTAESRIAWENWRKDHPQGIMKGPRRNIEELGLGASDSGRRAHNEDHDTIGALAMDAKGVLAGACTTSGLAYKLPGRVGDSPIIGHGLYVDPKHGAAVCTGHGELAMGVCGSFLAIETLRRGGKVDDAAHDVMKRIIESYDLGEEDQLGVIVLDPKGNWTGASLRPGFSVAVRSKKRDEMVNAQRVMFPENP